MRSNQSSTGMHMHIRIYGRSIQILQCNTTATYVIFAICEYLSLIPKFLAKPAVFVNPCEPSPCGPNSQCRVSNEQPVCSCIPGYVGNPPGCRPECVVSSECALDKACINQKCAEPCSGTCGLNTRCNIINHSPICTCLNEYTGDPFTKCTRVIRKQMNFRQIVTKLFGCILAVVNALQQIPLNPCIPSPCGPNSECRNINGNPSCSCLAGYFGMPPNCKPECTINAECSSHLACIREKCQDPCPGSCGISAKCTVLNHIPICTCVEGFTGDPFTQCIPKQEGTVKKLNHYCIFIKHLILDVQVDQIPSCNCGPNAICLEKECICPPDLLGDPYAGCRPECIINSECPKNRACLNNKCSDPCPGICGTNAECNVINHIPMCSCLSGYEGNAFIDCRLAKRM